MLSLASLKKLALLCLSEERGFLTRREAVLALGGINCVSTVSQ